jgi:hypothetical protein
MSTSKSQILDDESLDILMMNIMDKFRYSDDSFNDKFEISLECDGFKYDIFPLKINHKWILRFKTSISHQFGCYYQITFNSVSGKYVLALYCNFNNYNNHVPNTQAELIEMYSKHKNNRHSLFDYEKCSRDKKVDPCIMSQLLQYESKSLSCDSCNTDEFVEKVLEGVTNNTHTQKIINNKNAFVMSIISQKLPDLELNRRELFEQIKYAQTTMVFLDILGKFAYHCCDKC